MNLGFPRTLISICVVRPNSSKISRKAWRHGAFPGRGSTSKSSGPRPLSRRVFPASLRRYLIVLTALRAVDRWDARFGSLLELAEACSVPVRWACRTGVCHNCESGLVEGEVAYAPDPLDSPAEGNALICCSTPRTAVELDL